MKIRSGNRCIHTGPSKDTETTVGLPSSCGANQDSYAEGAKIGLDDGNVQNYSPDSDNVALAYVSMNRATSDFRSKPRSQRIADKADFFGGLKEAEQEMRLSKNR